MTTLSIESIDDKRVEELAEEAARTSMLAFLQYVWWMPQPLKIGRHTIEICEALTRAVFDWLDGKSTFLGVNVPFRHGKSDIVSRAFTAFFLGVCSDRQPDIIMSGYGSTLVETFSKQTRSIIRSAEYQSLFPGVTVDPTRDAADEWGISGSAGTVFCVGLGGAITGRGFHLGILDDYCKNREEAYSETYREKTWQSFAVDFMSRRNAPAQIVIVMATPWHPDDVTGRIRKAMEEDPLFPRFRFLTFPARKNGPDGWDTLFPEMYQPEWYDSHRATLGPTMAAALLDCHPVGDGTRMFKSHWFHSIGSLPERARLNVFIAVDSANAKKKTSDYTTMWVVGMGPDRNYYILDGIHERLDLAERTRVLFDLVEQWQPSYVFWEQIGAMSDVQHVEHEQHHRGWHFPIKAISQSVAKRDRIGWLVPTFEAGRIWFPHRMLHVCVDGRVYDLVRDFVEQEFSLYPASAHDDMLDALANIHHPVVTATMAFPVTPKQEDETQMRSRTTGSDWVPW